MRWVTAGAAGAGAAAAAPAATPGAGTVDQDRLRENIKALKDSAETRQLIARYVVKAGEQETRMEQIAAERRAVSRATRRLA